MSLLPEGYTRLWYIESTGQEWIDTEYIANDNTKWVMDGQAAGFYGNQGLNVMGACDDAAKRFHIGYYNGGNGWHPGVRETYLFCNTYDYNRHIFYLDGSGLFKVDNSSWQLTLTGDFPAVPVALFKEVRTSSVEDRYACQFRLWSCLFFENDVLVRDFIPARSSDGVVGLYDTVKNKFHTNKGSGSFIAGPKYINAYTKLLYLKCTGPQQINMWLCPTLKMWVDAQLSFDTYYNNYTFIIGMWANLSIGVHDNRLVFGSGGSESNVDPHTISFGTKYHYIFGQRRVLQDGVSLWSDTAYDNTPSTGYLYLFSNNYQWLSGVYADGKLYSVKVYDGEFNNPFNSTLLRDYIPVVDEFGTPGMLDKVSGVFFTNNGTGDFIKGPAYDIGPVQNQTTDLNKSIKSECDLNFGIPLSSITLQKSVNQLDWEDMPNE